MAAGIADEERRFYRDAFNALVTTTVPQTTGIVSDMKVTMINAESPDFISTIQKNKHYKNTSKPKGLALIINNREFDNPNQFPGRVGTDVDEVNAQKMLELFEYKVVKVKKNATAKGMMQAMVDFSKKAQHRDLDSAVVFVLTHGMMGSLCGIDAKLDEDEKLLSGGVDIIEFISMLNAERCPNLENKPKLFFLQACRGSWRDNRRTRLDYVDSFKTGNSPIETDLLVYYSSMPGYVSWRDEQRGSWFVQAVYEVFSEYAHYEDILHLLTKVNHVVASKTTTDGKKQMPQITSSLRKEFYFFPGYDGQEIKVSPTDSTSSTSTASDLAAANTAPTTASVSKYNFEREVTAGNIGDNYGSQQIHSNSLLK